MGVSVSGSRQNNPKYLDPLYKILILERVKTFYNKRSMVHVLTYYTRYYLHDFTELWRLGIPLIHTVDNGRKIINICLVQQ